MYETGVKQGLYETGNHLLALRVVKAPVSDGKGVSHMDFKYQEDLCMIGPNYPLLHHHQPFPYLEYHIYPVQEF